MENLFNVRNYKESAKAKLAVVEFSNYALHWWDKTTSHRARSGAPIVDSWTEFKMLMRQRFMPQHYYRDLHYKLMTLKQGSKSVEQYRQELELYLLRLSTEEYKYSSTSRLISALNRDIVNQLEMYPFFYLW